MKNHVLKALCAALLITSMAVPASAQPVPGKPAASPSTLVLLETNNDESVAVTVTDGVMGYTAEEEDTGAAKETPDETPEEENVVIDLSCRKKEDGYYIVTDRWQKFTDVKLTQEVLREIAGYCDEYLVHGVDVEGKSAGIDAELAKILGEFDVIPVTYAGGIASLEDIEHFRKKTGGKVDFTIGSALDLFGGHLPYEQIKKY